MNDNEFITITGYEAYIRDNKNCVCDVYGKEIHINLFAKNAENETIICYNPKYCKYIPDEQKEKYKKAGSQRLREYSVDYVNEFIKTAKEIGYIPVYNHPWWSAEEEKDIFSYKGFLSIEMCNYSSYLLGRLEYNAALYDKMLKKGIKIFCHSADDNHNGYPENSTMCDSFGGFTMIMPEEFTYNSIINAMEEGKMYSSMGPLFKEISIDKNKIHIECSEVDRIMVFTGSKNPKRLFAKPGETINQADFEIDDRAEFIRVSVVDKFGRYADTRGFFRDEICF